MKLIRKYFSQLSDDQYKQFEQLDELYNYWNNKINVISKKDIRHLYERHVLHSLSIARICPFHDKARILDAGTGGGFPGIPLGIFFPELKFTLIDSKQKKLKVVNAVAAGLGLSNITTIHTRVEDFKEKFDFIIGRAVSSFPKFVKWTRKNMDIHEDQASNSAIIYLSGGELETEIKPFADKIRIYHLTDFFDEEYFRTKKILYLLFK